MAKAMGRSTLLKVFTYRDIIAGESDISIEDMLPESILENAIQKYLAEILAREDVFHLSDLPDGSQSLGRKLVDYFETQGWTTRESRFSKTTVADFFTKILNDSEEILADDHRSILLCKELKNKLNLK